MPVAESTRIHPTAVISDRCQIAEDVTIGPFVVIEGDVRIGPRCQIGPYVHLRGALWLGARNRIYSGAVLGERPQHLRFDEAEETRLEIGDDNIIREHVTIHRGTTHRYVTTIGSHNFFMAGSHVAHDSIIGNHCVLANGALLGGHCILDDRAIISGNAAVHQFCRVGRVAMLGGNSGTSKDVPPFMIQQGINCITGVNLIGLRRAGVSSEAIGAVKHAYRRLFKDGLSVKTALERIEAECGQFEEIQELVHFIRNSTNGINPARNHQRGVWP
ncbi:MAG: acyl-ACP--UDP-N-acetylglucosamine O-acyltransferase [Pirellulales bacterium]